MSEPEYERRSYRMISNIVCFSGKAGLKSKRTARPDNGHIRVESGDIYIRGHEKVPPGYFSMCDPQIFSVFMHRNESPTYAPLRLYVMLFSHFSEIASQAILEK